MTLKRSISLIRAGGLGDRRSWLRRLPIRWCFLKSNFASGVGISVIFVACSCGVRSPGGVCGAGTAVLEVAADGSSAVDEGELSLASFCFLEDSLPSDIVAPLSELDSRYACLCRFIVLTTTKWLVLLDDSSAVSCSEFLKILLYVSRVDQ